MLYNDVNMNTMWAGLTHPAELLVTMKLTIAGGDASKPLLLGVHLTGGYWNALICVQI